MTLEQLAIFIAVAEREHLTRAADAIRLTPSAVSSAIKTLEHHYGVELFHRVGRRIELTDTGRIFLDEARETLARARSAELVLSELGGLMRGTLSVHASQTIASYWLPPRLMRFREAFPGIDLTLTLGNTRSVANAVISGHADLGFVEGDLDEPLLAASAVDQDELTILVAPDHPWAAAGSIEPGSLTSTNWIMRETGSGTRSVFEAALARMGVAPGSLNTALVLPSNEAILSALAGGRSAAAISRLAARSHIDAGHLVAIDLPLGSRTFLALHHRERRRSKAALELASICGAN
ncbi:MAG: LysR family transcriptional regulator [Rhizobium sp.]|nr:LysR family transcriptional regulator [Rhizobium sp.]